MKRTQKLLIALAIAMSCGIYTASAQIYVKIRPPRPVIIRTEPPSPRHVWIEEEWHPRGKQYEFSGGHWVEPPHEGARYIPGHWRHTSHGDAWEGGRWGGNRGHGQHDNRGHNKGRNNGHR